VILQQSYLELAFEILDTSLVYVMKKGLYLYRQVIQELNCMDPGPNLSWTPILDE